MDRPSRTKAKPVGILIRFCAALYDLMILLALAFLVFVPITVVEHALSPIPGWAKSLLFLTLAYAYFVGFWTHGGATTGMRPWRLIVTMADTGDPLDLAAATMRWVALLLTWAAVAIVVLSIFVGRVANPLFYIAAAIPLASLLCMLLTRARQPLHDWLAGTNVYRIVEDQ